MDTIMNSIPQQGRLRNNCSISTFKIQNNRGLAFNDLMSLDKRGNDQFEKPLLSRKSRQWDQLHAYTPDNDYSFSTEKCYSSMNFQEAMVHDEGQFNGASQRSDIKPLRENEYSSHQQGITENNKPEGIEEFTKNGLKNQKEVDQESEKKSKQLSDKKNEKVADKGDQNQTKEKIISAKKVVAKKAIGQKKVGGIAKKGDKNQEINIKKMENTEADAQHIEKLITGKNKLKKKGVIKHEAARKGKIKLSNRVEVAQSIQSIDSKDVKKGLDQEGQIKNHHHRESQRARLKAYRVKQTSQAENGAHKGVDQSQNSVKSNLLNDALQLTDLKSDASSTDIETKFSRYLKEGGIDKLVKQAKIILKDNNSGEIKLILKPEKLGSVKINLNINDKSIVGKIFVENSSIREAFKDSLAELNRALTESGFESSALDVSLSNNRFGGNSGFQEADDKIGHQKVDLEGAQSKTVAAMEFFATQSSQSLDLVL